MPRLVPCLVALRADFDEVFPDRKNSSDGWIADGLHDSTSDHQPDGRGLVHAIDVDAGLGEGFTMRDVVALIVQRCANGLEERLTYVIHDRVIWSSSRGWKPKAYTGSNPHTQHAHFSASALPAREQDTRSWHLEGVPMALTAEDKKWIAAEIRKVVTGDADPTARVYSLGGLAAITERRTAEIRDVLKVIEGKLDA
ncbi:hypothetical protein [Paractinoplanes hotanensis]|uniref:Uncharacterized protein n=1 Tax=Paractinoplanes hotanensis TaxID=2906497 RepID=A0ABT0Y2Z1_9ACTN|nr:hypothetical protein [Actinoplanes hotanensis]MCM4080401.1 hypothetical protein [Actinoplanes hotanensis]